MTTILFPNLFEDCRPDAARVLLYLNARAVVSTSARLDFERNLRAIHNGNPMEVETEDLLAARALFPNAPTFGTVWTRFSSIPV